MTTPDLLRSAKRWHIVAGVASILLGILVMAWPGPTVLTVAVILGIQLIFWGVAAVVTRIVTDSGSSMVLGIIGGVLAVLLGIVTFRMPAASIAMITIFVGAGWFVSGIFDLIESFRGPGTNWMGVLFGFVAFLAGIVMMSTPLTTAVALAWVSGIAMVVMGISRIFSAGKLAELTGAEIDLVGDAAMVDVDEQTRTS